MNSSLFNAFFKKFIRDDSIEILFAMFLTFRTIHLISCEVNTNCLEELSRELMFRWKMAECDIISAMEEAFADGDLFMLSFSRMLHSPNSKQTRKFNYPLPSPRNHFSDCPDSLPPQGSPSPSCSHTVLIIWSSLRGGIYGGPASLL